MTFRLNLPLLMIAMAVAIAILHLLPAFALRALAGVAIGWKLFDLWKPAP